MLFLVLVLTSSVNNQCLNRVKCLFSNVSNFSDDSSDAQKSDTAGLNAKITTPISHGTSSVDPITNRKNYSHPKPFWAESVEIQISMILGWIFRSESYQAVLDREDKIKNITSYLRSMRFNGYLRLFEVDMHIIKDRMTEPSWILFQDFKGKHEKDVCKCPLCTYDFVNDSVKWKCSRCLFYFHEKCSKGRKVSQDVNNEGYILCDTCFFKL